MLNDINKIKLKKQTKAYLYFTFAMIMVICIVALSRETIFRHENEKTITSESFVNRPSISYTVNLKPNPIFENNTLPEGNSYIGSIIDYININFQDELVGQSKAQISGDYTIKAQIIANNSDGEKSEKVWDKTYILSPKKQFEVNESVIKLSSDTPINYATYNSFAEQANAELKISTSNILRVEMNINYTVKTNEGLKMESFNQGLTIPLGTSFVPIRKDALEEKTIRIEKTILEKAPINYFKIIIISIMLVLAIILLILLKTKIKEPTLNELTENKIQKILKEHGNRLVAIDSKIPNDIENSITVHSMEDLIKISDEIERPVFYYYNSKIGSIKEFFILNGVILYVYSATMAEEDVTELEQNQNIASESLSVIS